MPTRSSWVLILLALGCASDPPPARFIETPADWTPDQLVSTTQPTALLFWAPWCEECIALMPAFERLSEQRRDAVKTSTVCVVEPGEDVSAAGPPQSTALDSYKWERPISMALAKIGVDGLPALLVFDRTGTAVHRIASSELEGALSAAELTDAIDAVAP